MSPKSIKRIVVPTDFSALSEEAIETALDFARELGAMVDLVHVATEMTYPLPPPMEVVTLPVDIATAVQEASSRLAAQEESLRGRGAACESNVLVGQADKEIVGHADKTHADLIIMGTHGRSGLGHMLIGSVAEKVVQHAHCPVLTLPAHREARA